MKGGKKMRIKEILKKIRKIFQERDPTRGSILKESLIHTSYLWPGTLLWVLIHCLNLFWLSRISIEAIAAVCIGSAGFMFLMVPIQGIVIATYGLVGSFDREDRAGLERQVKQILSATWLVSIILALLGCFLAPPLLQLLGAESEVISLAVDYLRILAIFGIVSFSFWPVNQMIRNTGQMGHGMLFVNTVLILQGIFDYLFILGNWGFPQWGVVGAAISRGLSALIGAAIVFWWLCSGKAIIKLNLKKWQDYKININTLKEIVRIAGFDTIQGFCRQTTQMFMLAIVAPFGTLALGAYEIGQRFFRYCAMSIMDVGQTTAIGCARNTGAGKINRAKKWSWTNTGIAALLMGLGGLSLFILAPQIIGIFNQNPEVIGIGVSYFKITTLAGIGYVFFATSITLQRAFGAAKDTFTPMVAYLAMMALQIGLAIGFSTWFGISGVWWAILAGMIFYGSVLTILFKTDRWRPKPVGKDAGFAESTARREDLAV